MRRPFSKRPRKKPNVQQITVPTQTRRMNSISEQIEQLSASLISADASDLQILADAHARFEQLAQCVKESGTSSEAMVGCVDRMADSARTMLEQLILMEVDDTAQQLSKVMKTLADLQQLMTTGALPDALVSTDTVQKAFSDSQPKVDVASHEQKSLAKVFADDELELLREFITESSGHLESAEQQMLILEEDPTNTEALSCLFRAFHTIKGVAGFLDLQQIQALAHVTESLMDKARNGQLQLTGTAGDLVMRSIDIGKALVGCLDVAASTRSPLAVLSQVDPLVEKIDGFLAGKQVEASEALSSHDAPEAINIVKAATKVEVNSEVAAADQSAGNEAKPQGDGTVKVATDRLDRLIDMVGELVIANSMVAQDLGPSSKENVRLSRHLGHLGKIVRELQDLSMSLRMVQVQQVFTKMKRLARDTSRKMMKDVELILSGSETELDRNVVEALADPLMHMVRNSIDHGIETPDVRVKAGKKSTGRVELKAFHKGGSINIEITDDGKGLNKERILKKAIEAGIVAPDAVLPDSEIYKLIFAAGLSTADKVTDISGRGVGMDVVKQNIEKLRGRVDISSTPGVGSIFTIRLPLTLAVIDGLVVKVGQHKYIVPINSIEQSLRPTPDMLSTVNGRGELVSVRGALLPLLRLHDLFGVEPTTQDPTKSLVVIVHENDRRACLLVDELLGQEQVVIKNLGEGIGDVRGISGGAVLGDGNVSLIVDVPGLFDVYSNQLTFN